jgi:outer membrane protein TolC
LTLSASLGSQALTVASLFGSGSLIWGLGGQLAQPLFTPGLKSQAKAAEAAAQAALANYQQIVLQSLREVADVLRTVEHDAQVQQSLTLADTSARQSLQLVQKQHALPLCQYDMLQLAPRNQRATR